MVWLRGLVALLPLAVLDGCGDDSQGNGRGGSGGSATTGGSSTGGSAGSSGTGTGGSGNAGGEPGESGRPSTGGSSGTAGSAGSAGNTGGGGTGAVAGETCWRPDPPPGGAGHGGADDGGGGDGQAGAGTPGGAWGATGACTSDPCENGALCIEEAVGGTSCVCPPGFGGERCELELRFCCDPTEPGVDPAQCRRAQIDAGFEHTCHLGENGALTCWGGDRFVSYSTFYDGASTPPNYVYEQLSISGESCAIDKHGVVTCWGLGENEDLYDLDLPVGRHNRVSTGYHEICTLDADFRLRCARHLAQRVPSDRRYIALSSNRSFVCAIDTLREVECFRVTDRPRGITEPPSGPFLEVSTGDRHACGLRADHTVACWGENPWGQATPPSGAFLRVSAGGRHSCAVRENGELVCWGDAPYTGAPSGTFVDVSAGETHTCALRSDGKVACWGDDRMFQIHPPLELAAEPDSFVSIAVGGTAAYENDDHLDRGAAFGCGLDSSGALECWGEPLGTPPTGEFEQVAVGYGSACAIRTDGTLSCWGDIVVEPDSPPVTYAHVSVGYTLACAVRTTGALECWELDIGDPTWEPIVPPSGTFTQVSVNSDRRYDVDEDHWDYKPRACALATDGSVQCFGSRQSNFDGPFVHVVAGIGKDCALDADGVAWCWGSAGDPRQGDGKFMKIGLGYHGLAGLRPDGRFVWESPPRGETPPTDRFVDVSVAGDFACGLRADGKVRCFGALER